MNSAHYVPVPGVRVTVLQAVDAGHVWCIRQPDGTYKTQLPTGLKSAFDCAARHGLLQVNEHDPIDARRWQLSLNGRRELDHHTKDVTTA